MQDVIQSVRIELSVLTKNIPIQWRMIQKLQLYTGTKTEPETGRKQKENRGMKQQEKSSRMRELVDLLND